MGKEFSRLIDEDKSSLYYNIICPFSRHARVMLRECGVDFVEKIHGNVCDNSYIDILPIFNLYRWPEDFTEMIGSSAIIEYLHKEYCIFSENTKNAADARSICEIFNMQFYYEVMQPILYEKIIRFYHDRSMPNSGILFAKKNLANDYIKMLNNILEHRNCLAGDTLSVADFCVASHLSCLDYMGIIIWNNFPLIKKWYCRLKSRPSFKCILDDRIQLIQPVKHYSMLDF